MGASGSKMEEDKALQLCRERKKFVRQALDGRCSLAAAHVTYIQSLKNTGSALRRFVEPEAPVASSLCTSTNATPEPLALTEKSLSQFSFSPSISQRVDATETYSPSPSPPSSIHFQANHMKIWGFPSKKVEERPPEPVVAIALVTSSSATPQDTTPRSPEKPESSPFEDSSLPPVTAPSPWDYFGLSPPMDHGKELNQGLENADNIRQLREQEGIPELEDEDKASFHEREGSPDSDDEFDEPSTDTLVRRFENLNRVHEPYVASASPIMPSVGSVASETEFMNGEKSNTPYLSPLRATPSTVNGPNDAKKTPVKEGSAGSKVAPEDFLSRMKDIEFLFIKASDSGKEVPRMLEANKWHFRSISPGKNGGSRASMFLKACFSCGEDPSQVKEEPPQTTVKYLTWQRTTSSRSFSSGNPMELNGKDDVEDLTNNLFNNICMISASHASTLDRLYAWERKLYDEVKASEAIRREYDLKCKDLRLLESKVRSAIHRIGSIDKTRAVVKDLHSRIRVAIHRIDSISKRIEELRDKELQPQLEELIEGLSRMWEVMLECHKRQDEIIAVAFSTVNMKISVQSESHRQMTAHLENELSSLSSSFSKWIDAQKAYLQAINNWLLKCVFITQKSSKKRWQKTPLVRDCGPPIYVTVGVWLEKLERLPRRGVSDSIKGLTAEVSHFLPHQGKNQGKNIGHSNATPWKGDTISDSGANLLGDDVSEDWNSCFDRFHKRLVKFVGQLNEFAEASAEMYAELDKDIQNAKNKYIEKLAHDLRAASMR
ncbi:hypothetical protein SLE2022_197100 [Rubroshorea leprosula]